MASQACVVGAGGGIGAATVRRLAQDGWSVIEMDRDHGIRLDLTDPSSVERAFAAARAQAPSIGLLVIASGILDLAKLAELDLTQWNRTLAVNLTGPFLCCKAARDWIAEDGRIVLVGSLAGRTGGLLTGTAYAVSKGGIESLTKSLAQELAPRRITVNCVAPGGIETPMFAQNPADRQAGMASATPLRRVGRPEEVAATIAFLASAEAAFITGATIPVNGGLRMD